MNLGSNNRLRKTSKALWVLDHRVLWKCIVMTKEKDGKFWLFGWGIDKNENALQWLQRELWEELWKSVNIIRTKALFQLQTETQIHNVFAVQLAWKANLQKKELDWVWFYPLDKKYTKEREILKKQMQSHAIKAIEKFEKEHNIDVYNSSKIKLWGEYFDRFKDDLMKLLK